MSALEIASDTKTRSSADSAQRRSFASLFARGFRPFFLAAGLFAVAVVARWLAIWLGLAAAPGWLSPLL